MQPVSPLGLPYVMTWGREGQWLGTILEMDPSLSHFMHSFIHLVNTYNVRGIVLNLADTTVNKTHCVIKELMILRWREVNRQLLQSGVSGAEA